MLLALAVGACCFLAGRRDRAYSARGRERKSRGRMAANGRQSAEMVTVRDDASAAYDRIDSPFPSAHSDQSTQYAPPPRASGQFASEGNYSSFDSFQKDGGSASGAQHDGAHYADVGSLNDNDLDAYGVYGVTLKHFRARNGDGSERDDGHYADMSRL